MGSWRSQRYGKTVVWDAIVEKELGQLWHSAEEQMELAATQKTEGSVRETNP